MKKIVSFLVFVSISLFVFGCNNPYASLNDFKVEGYIEAPGDIFTPSANQNKLSGTLMYVDGKITKIDNNNTPSPAYYVETSHGLIAIWKAEYMNHWSDLKVGENIRTYFLYVGILQQTNIATGFYIAYIDPKNVPTEIPEDILSAKAKYSKPPTVKEQIPTYVQEIYNNFDRVLASNNFSVSLDEGSLEKTNDWGNYVFYVSGETYSKSITFISDGSKTQNAFFAGSDFKASRERTEELITIILMATNPTIDKDVASSMMKDLVNSYQEKGPSKVIENGEYLVFLTSDILKDIQAVHKDEIYFIDKSLYVKADNKTILGNSRVYIFGTVKNVVSEWDSLLGTKYTITFNGEDGKEYYMVYYFNDIPIVLKTGDKYTAYGIVSDDSEESKPCINLEKLELK